MGRQKWPPCATKLCAATAGLGLWPGHAISSGGLTEASRCVCVTKRGNGGNRCNSANSRKPQKARRTAVVGPKQHTHGLMKRLTHAKPVTAQVYADTCSALKAQQ